jgi:hypothetical protein
VLDEFTDIVFGIAMIMIIICPSTLIKCVIVVRNLTGLLHGVTTAIYLNTQEYPHLSNYHSALVYIFVLCMPSHWYNNIFFLHVRNIQSISCYRFGKSAERTAEEFYPNERP